MMIHGSSMGDVYILTQVMLYNSIINSFIHMSISPRGKCKVNPKVLTCRRN